MILRNLYKFNNGVLLIRQNYCIFDHILFLEFHQIIYIKLMWSQFTALFNIVNFAELLKSIF